MLRPETAWEILANHATPLPAEAVPRAEALGRVLAEPLTATVDQPPGDVSAMDGYAVAGPYAAGRALPVVGTLAAGAPSGPALAAGQALRIMTGAVLPAGADRVVPRELSDRESGGDAPGERVVFRRELDAGANVRRGGEIVRRGAPLFAAGEPLGPGALALAAAHGYDRLPVHRAPRLAMLSTGDEVVPASAVPGPSQLRDSHTDFLRAACRTLGLDCVSLGLAKDEPAALREHLRGGLESDLLLVCGGVSAGDFDRTPEVLAELGCTPLLHGVAIQPGRPLLAARHAQGLVLGLPGNPAAVMTCFWLFARPLLRRLLGFADGFWRGTLRARLTAPLPGAKDRDRFVPARLASAAGELEAWPLADRGSHDLWAWSRGTALLRVTAGSPPRAAGEPCDALPILPWLDLPACEELRR